MMMMMMTKDQFKNYIDFVMKKSPGLVKRRYFGPLHLLFWSYETELQYEIYWSDGRQAVLGCTRAGMDYQILPDLEGMEAIIWFEAKVDRHFTEEMGLEILLL